jgi:hypothetical protein
LSVIPLVGANTGANTISGIEDGKEGQTLELVGTSNEKYVEIKNAQSIELSQDNIMLGEVDSLSLSFSTDSNKWIEKSYTNYNN